LIATSPDATIHRLDSRIGTQCSGHIDPLAGLHPTFSVIAPVHNEEAVLPHLYRRIRTVMDQTGAPWELVLVNDGSRGRSAQVIHDLHNQDPRVVGLSLSRNL
jgi:hypothetical protein